MSNFSEGRMFLLTDVLLSSPLFNMHHRGAFFMLMLYCCPKCFRNSINIFMILGWFQSRITHLIHLRSDIFRRWSVIFNLSVEMATLLFFVLVSDRKALDSDWRNETSLASMKLLRHLQTTVTINNPLVCFANGKPRNYLIFKSQSFKCCATFCNQERRLQTMARF